MVDPERMSAARKSAMLERAELSDLSKTLELTRIAEATGISTGGQKDVLLLREILAAQGVALTGKRIGISRDELAKLETGGRKRPRITTLRKFLDTVNYARALRDKPPIDVEDLQVPGEVLIPAPREETEDIRSVLDREAEEAEAVADAEQSAIDAYQEASNEIYYATIERDEETG
jgi:transcriptional regulator with XRE-family HTH domain